MKTIITTVLTLIALAFTASAASADEANKAGPNGGRLITSVTPHTEFFVTAERKVQITFVGEDGKPVAPSAQVVTVTTGDRLAPTRLAFTAKENVLLSEGSLPDGNDFPTVVLIKTSPEARNVYARFNLNMAVCGGCQKAEYACTCGH